MRPDKTVERLLGQLQYRSGSAEQDRISDPVDRAWQRHEAQQRVSSASQASGRRAGRLVKLAAVVAMALIGLGVSIAILDRSTGLAYALEQTVEAVKDVRYFHFRFVGPERKDVHKEAWVEYDQDRQLKNVRVNFFMLDSVMVWSDGITQYLNSDVNELSIFEDAEHTDKILSFADRHDPRSAIDYFRHCEAEGDVRIEIGEPAEQSDLIPVTVIYEPNTYLIGQPMPRVREIFHVDPATKFLSHIDVHVWRKDSFADSGVWEYLDYNQPFEPGMFDLEKETDPNTTRFNTLGLDLGIEQGEMSERETALKVTSEFLAAWKSKDYDRAVRIHGYVNRSNRENTLKMLKKSDLLQVVELGEPSPAEPPMRGYTLRCTLQIRWGNTTDEPTWDIRVRRRTPKRWRIEKVWP